MEGHSGVRFIRNTGLAVQKEVRFGFVWVCNFYIQKLKSRWCHSGKFNPWWWEKNTGEVKLGENSVDLEWGNFVKFSLCLLETQHQQLSISSSCHHRQWRSMEGMGGSSPTQGSSWWTKTPAGTKISNKWWKVLSFCKFHSATTVEGNRTFEIAWESQMELRSDCILPS